MTRPPNGEWATSHIQENFISNWPTEKKREFILLGLQQGFELLELMQKGRISEETAQKYSEIHQLLDQLSVNQFNTQLWLRLSDRFASLGEKAQEKYCLAYCQPTDPFAPKLS